MTGPDHARYGTHSMWRTKATLVYRRTKNLRSALEISEQNGSLIGLDDVCLNGRLGRAFGHFVEYERPNSAAGP